jgi:carboxymethylenebutenolidase
MAQTLSVESAGDKMNLYEVRPEGTPRGAVIVVQEAFGITEHIKDVCRRVAAEGYVAAAPHIFHRSGDPVIAYDKMEAVIPHVMSLSAEGLEADLDATLDHLSGAGFAAGQTGIIGFCMGGSVSFMAGARRALGAAVTFYGGGITQGRFGIPPLVELAKDLQTPWLGLYGDLDQTIPLTEVEVLRKAAKAAKVPTEITRYADAGHGFHCDHRASYHEESSKDAWRRTVEWLNTHIKARS